MELVLQRHGIMEGDDLSDVIHGEDPWKNAAKNAVIPKEIMRDFYFARWCNDGEPTEDSPAPQDGLECEKCVGAMKHVKNLATAINMGGSSFRRN